MNFDWNSLGSAPADDEFEVSFIGPGFGECLVIHVGNQRWVVVDSCVDTTDSDRRPVAERYLRALGVHLESNVDLIVASHWHADHVRGIGRLVAQCRAARFSCANALVQREFITFVWEMATASASTDGAKVNEFREAIHHIRERDAVITWATANKLIRRWPATQSTPEAVIHALSPSDKEYTLFLQEVAAARPTATSAKRSASATTPNLASVVLHVSLGTSSVLLGADMEVHHDRLRGWSAAIDSGCQLALPPAGVLKVPHHGSVTGHHDEMWTHLLTPGPMSVATPFNRQPDNRKLPTTADIVRLSGLSSALFLTSVARNAPARGREAAVERSLRERGIVIRDAATPIGMVRLRKHEGSDWRREVFAPALLQSQKEASA